MISIPEGNSLLGLDFHNSGFAWDNEFPSQLHNVPTFSISEYPVTNGEFLEFVESNQYNNPSYWLEEDWNWKESINMKYPHSWTKKENKWFYRTVFEEIPLEKVLNWCIYVSHAEAVKKN